MSKTHSPFEKLNELVEKRREKGLKLLFISEIVKNVVINANIQQSSHLQSQFSEDDINRECMKVSKEILDKCKENPSEEDIKKILLALKGIKETFY